MSKQYSMFPVKRRTPKPAAAPKTKTAQASETRKERKEFLAKVERAKVILAEIQKLKPLYKELDKITPDLLGRETEIVKYRLTFIDNFAENNLIWKSSPSHRFELKLMGNK